MWGLKKTGLYFELMICDKYRGKIPVRNVLTAITKPCYTKLQLIFGYNTWFWGFIFILSQTKVIQHGHLHQQ
jgi:hypothetical protein